MQLKFIDHLVLMVKDISKTEKFYSSFLGKPMQIDKEQVVYIIGETKIFFGLSYGVWEEINKDNSGLNHLAFGVRTHDELKEVEEILIKVPIKNSGIQIDTFGNKEFIWIDDPNDYRIEFYSRPHI